MEALEPVREKSCGAVVFTRSRGKILYLLICSPTGVWGFPKGHVEAGESERETALREIREETGLRVGLYPDFRETDEYFLAREISGSCRKQVVFFLASYQNQAYTPQESEVEEIRLVPYREAMSLLRYDTVRRILARAHDFLIHQGVEKTDGAGKN